MQPIIMQDWITIRGVSSGVVIMSQSDWILTAPFQDIAFYLDVREQTATSTLAYETCPSRDEVLFQPMGTVSISAGALGLTVSRFALSGAPAVPVSHWSRWKLTGPASAWDITFRIMAAGNSVG